MRPASKNIDHIESLFTSEALLRKAATEYAYALSDTKQSETRRDICRRDLRLAACAFAALATNIVGVPSAADMDASDAADMNAGEGGSDA